MEETVADSGLFAAHADPHTEVRTCAKCAQPTLVCVRLIQHTVQQIPGAAWVTRNCICQNCGMQVDLHDPKRIRALRRAAWLLIWGIVPTPIFLWLERSRKQDWVRNPLAHKAPYPEVRYRLLECNRRCGDCGKVAYPVSVTRHRTNGLPAGTDICYRCAGCSAEFEVKSANTLSVVQAAFCIAAGTAGLIAGGSEGWLLRFVISPLAIAFGMYLVRDAVRNLRTAARNPKIASM